MKIGTLVSNLFKLSPEAIKIAQGFSAARERDITEELASGDNNELASVVEAASILDQMAAVKD